LLSRCEEAYVESTRRRSYASARIRSATGGAEAEDMTKIYALGTALVVGVVAFLTFTRTGHVIDKATQHFMLFYAGVFALIALCASTGLGLLATVRTILDPARRVLVQSLHRAASFAAVTFLVIHIVTEIVARRVHVIDAFVPFLSPFRTFYIGIGTIAADLVVLMVITGIYRKRFTTNGRAWRWRAIHYTSYAGFVLGIWHGLLAGRTAKPYVDWSYGLVIALVLLGLGLRIFSQSLRPREMLSTPVIDDHPASTTPVPWHVAALGLASGLGRRGAHALGPRSAPVPQAIAAGPHVRAATGPQPRIGSGPIPRAATGPQPRVPTGPQPRVPTGPTPPVRTGPQPRVPTGPQPQFRTGPQPRVPTGPQPAHVAPGPRPRPAYGSEPASRSCRVPAPPRACPPPGGRPWTPGGPWDRDTYPYSGHGGIDWQ
jgi:hypothetical protein